MHSTAEVRAVLALVVLCCTGACTPDAKPPRAGAKTATPPPPAPPPQPPPLDCPAGWGDCNAARDDGCETALDATDAHCGGCGSACEPGRRCVAGACRAGTVALAAGSAHSCALDAGGRVRCWGLGSLGQLGRASRRAARAPVPVEQLSEVRQLSAGRDFTCARRDDGVWCWGEGALGHGDGGTPQPRRVEGTEQATQVAAGIGHACAVLQGGGVLCWGEAAAGQLGDGSVEAEGIPSPASVAGVDDAVAAAAGGAHSCALSRAGRVSCWGMNRFGQLGDGTTEDRLQPTAVTDLQDVVALSLGQFHSCALGRDGALRCWGRNASGQLGLGDREDRHAPTVVLRGIAEVAAGQRHTCARTREGRGLCWGDNTEGQLGDGSHEDRLQPTPIAGPQRVIALSAGERHGCVLDAAGGAHCFGLGDGRLGDGSLRSSPTPVAVAR